MSRLAITLLLLWPAGLCLTGCGPKGPVRHEISGTVTFKKEPLNIGIIEFEPMDGQPTKSGAEIKDGQYFIPRDVGKGLLAGRYKVSIIGGDGYTGEGKAEPTLAKPGFVPGRERIPPKYNEKSTLIVNVKDGEDNRFDFDI